MANNDDDIMTLKPNEIRIASHKAKAFKKDYKKCDGIDMKVDYFNSLCGSPKEQAELYWSLEEMAELEDDEEMEEFLEMLKNLPGIKYCLEMYHDLSVLFKRAVALFLENMRTFAEESQNKEAVRKHKKNEEKFYTAKDGSYVRRKAKKRDKGDSQNGVMDKETSSISSAERERRAEKPRENVTSFKESISTIFARQSHCKGGAKGGVDFGWSSEGSDDSFFRGMSFNDDSGFGMGK